MAGRQWRKSQDWRVGEFAGAGEIAEIRLIVALRDNRETKQKHHFKQQDDPV